jgi:hypothetical protein
MRNRATGELVAVKYIEKRKVGGAALHRGWLVLLSSGSCWGRGAALTRCRHAAKLAPA